MTLQENITLAYFVFFGRPAAKELSCFSWTRGLGKCYSKDNKKKWPPFYKLLYKKSPRERKIWDWFLEFWGKLIIWRTCKRFYIQKMLLSVHTLKTDTFDFAIKQIKTRTDGFILDCTWCDYVFVLTTLRTLPSFWAKSCCFLCK